MLRIDGQQRGSITGDLAHEDWSGRYETFLVGERGAGALANCRERRLEARGAYDRCYNPIGRTACRFDQRVSAGTGLDAGAAQPSAKLGVAGLVGNDRKLRAMLNGKLGE